MGFLKQYGIAFVVFFLTDMIWLSVVAKQAYVQAYRPWLRLSPEGALQPVWWAAVAVYLLFALGIVALLLPLANGSLFKAIAYGVLFGGVTYGVYDFTCLALFKDWPVLMSVIDVLWGSCLCAWATSMTQWLGRFSH